MARLAYPRGRSEATDNEIILSYPVCDWLENYSFIANNSFCPIGIDS
jgi:hypothetical protein